MKPEYRLHVWHCLHTSFPRCRRAAPASAAVDAAARTTRRRFARGRRCRRGARTGSLIGLWAAGSCRARALQMMHAPPWTVTAFSLRLSSLRPRRVSLASGLDRALAGRQRGLCPLSTVLWAGSFQLELQLEVEGSHPWRVGRESSRMAARKVACQWQPGAGVASG
jgi:hypothetical protein